MVSHSEVGGPPADTRRDVTVHPTADVSADARLGPGVVVWNWTKVREDASIGADTSIGQHGYVDRNVVVGERCRIQNAVNLYDGLTVGDEVFIGPAVTFTNDLNPRAVGEWSITPTVVESGASIGANATIVCGVTLGRGCLVAAGSVVTADVPPGALVMGVPARVVGTVERDGTVRRTPVGASEGVRS